jgi:signal transduction histidine kinase
MTSSSEVRQKIASVAKTKSDNVDYAKTSTDLKNKLGSIIEKNPKIDSIFVVDNSDKILVSVDGLNTIKSLNQDSEQVYKSIVRLENANSSKKQNSKDSSNISFVLAIKNGKPIIVFTNRILDENGNVLANVLININFDQIISVIFDQSSSNVSSETYLVGKLQNKNLIISKDFQGIKEDNEILSNLGVSFLIEEDELKGDKNRAEYKNYMGALVFGSYSWIENLNIALISEIKQKTVSDPTNRALENIALIATGLVIFMTAICYVLVRQRIRAVLAVTDIALSITAGNLEDRFPVNQKDEIGALAIALNNMLDRFKYLNEQIIESQYVFSQQINHSDEILHNFMNSINEGVAFLDRNNLVSQINFSLAEILSVSISDATGARYDSILPEKICEIIDSIRWKRNEVAATEFLIPYQGNYKAKVSNVFSEVPNDSTKIQFLGIVVVIWESSNHALPLYSSEAEYNAAISNSVYKDIAIRNQVANNLRIPMTSMLGFLKLTKGKLDGVIFPKLTSVDQESRSAIRQISNNFEIMISESTQIAVAIENILEDQTSGSEMLNDLKQKLEIVFVSDILNQVHLETVTLFKEKNSTLIFDIVDLGSASIECNREEILYVFTNLLTRTANLLNQSRFAVCHARIVNNQIAVTIGKLNALLSHKQILSILNDVYKLVKNIGHDQKPSRDAGVMTIQDILHKYNGTISLERVESLRNRYEFYVVTLPIR